MDLYDEKLGETAAIESDIQHLSLKELLAQRNGLSSRITYLNNEISDLAFNNYRTYADAGRTAEHCKEMFSSIHNDINNVKIKIPKLVETVKGFSEKTNTFHKEYENVTMVSDKNNLLWKIVDMPKLMEKCIQTGEYESAFALTDFAVNLKNSRVYHYPIIKKPVDYVIEARHGLLDELFDKFTGPIDLSKSILVVNNIRKIPYISNTQLRVSILHYRDIYLDNLVAEAMKNSEYIYKLIDIYRDCMYDTMVLYLAVFPEVDIQRRTATTNDPRWERWTGSSQNYLLQAWAHKNLEQLLEQIRCYTGSKINYEAIREKLMSFASSFGRMGLDFRLLILDEFRMVDIRIFQERVSVALMNLIEKQSLNLVDSEIVEMARNGLIQNNALDSTVLPLDMIAWDDLVIYANEIINGLNDLRFSLSVNQINDLFMILQNSFKQLSNWIDGFLNSEDDGPLAKRAARIVVEHFIPFLQSHFTALTVPLQEKWRIKDEDDLELKQESFVFKIDCISYEPSMKEEEKLKELTVNGNSEGLDQHSPRIGNVPVAPQLSSFVSSFADQMSSLWTDEPIHQQENEMKMEKSQELNKRFEKAISGLAKDGLKQEEKVPEDSTQMFTDVSQEESKENVENQKLEVQENASQIATDETQMVSESERKDLGAKVVFEIEKDDNEETENSLNASDSTQFFTDVSQEESKVKEQKANENQKPDLQVNSTEIGTDGTQIPSGSGIKDSEPKVEEKVENHDEEEAPIKPVVANAPICVDATQEPPSDATTVGSSENFSEPFSDASLYEQAFTSEYLSKIEDNSMKTVHTTSSKSLIGSDGLEFSDWTQNESGRLESSELESQVVSHKSEVPEAISSAATHEKVAEVLGKMDSSQEIMLDDEEKNDDWGWGENETEDKSDDIKTKKED